MGYIRVMREGLGTIKCGEKLKVRKPLEDCARVE